jgi:hypothetical protein
VAFEWSLVERPVNAAGPPSAIAAPAAKATNPLAKAVPIGTGRLIMVLTFCIVLTSCFLDHLLN